MARFHAISSTFEPEEEGSRWRFDLETTLFRPLEKVKPYFAADPAGFAWLQQAAEQVEHRLAQLDVSVFPFIQPDHLKLRLGLIQQLMKKNWPSPFSAPAFLAG
jgi:hypothetical protein